MKLSKSIMIGTAALLLPMSAFADGDKTSWDGQAAGERYSASGAETSDRALTDDEIRNIIAQSGADGSNPDIRYMGQGLEVHEARTGAEGLRKIVELQPDAAIIDIGLPEMDGHEVARRVRKHADVGLIPLVALTGYGRDSDRQEVKASGYDLHLIKPLNPEQLDGIIAGLEKVDRTSEPVS